jgi:hypothetical protein
MQHGSDLIGIRFFLMLHHDPDFIMFTKILKDKYDHSIDDQTDIDALLLFDDVRDKLVSTALKDLKLAFAKSVVEQSIHLNTTTVANNGLSFLSSGWINLVNITLSNLQMILPKQLIFPLILQVQLITCTPKSCHQ